MQNREISRQLQRLYDLIQRVPEAAGADIEMQSHWARYICVLASGLLENAIAEIYGSFAARASSKPVADFTSAALAGIQNPNAQRFLEVAGRFKSAWREELEDYLNENGRREAINSIIHNRHQIAHGNYSGITLARIADYLEKAVEVIEYIEGQCAR